MEPTNARQREGGRVVSTLSVWKFPTPTGAEEALEKLEGLQRQELITVLDGAIVSWPADKKRPKTTQVHSMAGVGALGGAFWGLLFGLIFFAPFLGMAIGAGFGGLTGSLADVGIDDGFIESVRSEVTPATSALFVLTQDAVLDRIHDEFKDFQPQPELIQSNLSSEQEAKLRTVFAED
jgi:uncharacterized membrane protein